MSVEFVNAYIERLVHEVQELTKTKLLNETRITMLEKANADLVEKNDKLEEKNIKKKPKEVDTF